jgi:hypothetical protein
MQTRHHRLKKVSVLLLGLSVLLLTVFTTAHADTISFTTSTPIVSTLTDWTSSLAFQQFNPSYGTLQSVELDLRSGLQTTLTISNLPGAGSATGNAKTEVQVSVVDSGNYITDQPQIDFNSPAYAYTGLAAGDSTTSGLLTKTGTSSSVYTLASLLAEFTGAGNISLTASTFTQTLLANTGGNTSASQVTNAGLTGDVIYTYTPPASVPLPSALLLLGPGLIGLVGLRKRYTA